MKQYGFVYHTFEEIQSFIYSKNINKSDTILIQIFTGTIKIEFIQNIIHEILSILPQAEILGTTTAGEIFGGTVLNNTTIISLTIFEKTKIKSKLLNSNGNNNEYELGINIAKELVYDDTKVIILFSDGFLTNSLKIVEGIASVNSNIIICGGKAGDNGYFNKTFVFTNKGITQNGVAAVSLTGTQLYVTTQWSFGWTPIGKLMTITKASNNRIYTIDNIKTTDIYKKYLGEQVAKELPMSATEFPLIVIKDGIEMAKVAYSCNEDGSLSFLSNIETNDKVQFGYGNVNLLIDQSLQITDRLRQQNVEALFIYSCSVIRSFLQDKINIATSNLNNIAPTFGFLTYGEFFTINNTNKLLNITFTILGISEKEQFCTPNKFPLVKEEPPAKNFFEKKEFGAIKVFTHLVNTTTKELKLANEILEEQKYKIEKMNNITKSILQINSEMISSGGFDDFLQILLDKILDIIPNSNTGSILILENDLLYYKAIKGYASDKIKDKVYNFKNTLYYKQECIEDLINPIILDNLENIMFNEVHEYNDWVDMLGKVPSELLTSVIGVDGQVEGTINIFNTSKEKKFTEEDKRILKYLCYDIAMAIRNYKLLKNIFHMSVYDNLTGLYNRHYFIESLNKTKLSGKKFIICMLDLNDLKIINDTYGHDAGDKTLIKFAHAFKMIISKNDILGRLGGDEFAGIFINKNKAQVMEIINKVCNILENCCLVFDGNKKKISFAYGLSEFSIDSEDINELLKIADTRMYENKRMMKVNET